MAANKTYSEMFKEIATIIHDNPGFLQRKDEMLWDTLKAKAMANTWFALGIHDHMRFEDLYKRAKDYDF